MDWATAPRLVNGRQEFLMVSKDGGIESVTTDALRKFGIPRTETTTRVNYTGPLTSWFRISEESFLRAFDIEVPHDLMNQHAVFCSKMEDGLNVIVPSLVLVRAFYRPHNLLLPLVFTPGNADVLGFVDHSQIPPTIVLDTEYESRIGNPHDVATRYEPLRWIHSSHSARTCSQSVQTNAAHGKLDMNLPKGDFRLVLHGNVIGSTLYVTKARVTSVTVNDDDIVSKNPQTFFFHGKAAPDRKVSASLESKYIPLGSSGSFTLSDEEWLQIEPTLGNRSNYRQIHCKRKLFDAMLVKLSSKQTWNSVCKAAGFDVNTLTMAFRRWELDGRFRRALEQLALARGVLGE